MVGVVLTCLSWLGRQFSSCWNNFGTLAILLTLLALLLDYMKRRNRDSRLPPGPTPLPFIGNLLLLDRKNPQNTLIYLEKKFGEAVSIQIGWKKFVILNKYKLIKEALIEKSEEFVEHPEVPLLKLIGRTKNCGGIFVATGSSGLKEQRKFCISAVKHFGKALRNVVSEEAEYLCSEFKTKKGLPFNPHNLILRAATNVICTLIFNERFEHKDESYTKLMHATEEILNTLTGILPQLLAITGDWMRYIPGPHRKLQKNYTDFSAMIKEAIKKHKETRDPTYPRDFIDMFLDEIEKDKGNSDSSFNEQNLINVIFDVFAAGSKTAAHTVLWGLLIMVLHPEIQERIHEEIDNVIGKARSPSMDDQANLPYTCAVISEIQRYVDIVPVLMPYVTNGDVEIGKYVIPKDTIVAVHLSSLMKDETMWEKPHEFYPEHFLDTNGQLVKKANFLPFSAGRRSCPGEQLAKMELFLFFTSLLQQFTFVIPKNSPRPEEKPHFCLIINAPPFQISTIPR